MKKVLAALMVTAFAFCVGTAFAKTEKCKITTVDGDTVTMTCKDNELKVDDTVKVKKEKKKVVEGC
jgi:ribosomal protein S4E